MRPPLGIAPPVDAPVPDPRERFRLEVLVYSEVAAERMVFINGRKYVQGDSIVDGPRIDEIRPDSVVLTEQGRRFTLQQR